MEAPGVESGRFLTHTSQWLQLLSILETARTERFRTALRELMVIIAISRVKRDSECHTFAVSEMRASPAAWRVPGGASGAGAAGAQNHTPPGPATRSRAVVRAKARLNFSTMTIHPIVITGEPVLRRKAARVETFDEDLRTLVDDMRETLTASHGVGLAAPQIGVDKQIFVYDADDDVAGVRRSGVFINPVLVASRVPDGKPDPDEDSEGCLSVPGLDFPLLRASKVTVNGVDERGEVVTLTVEGWFARIMQHEFDHLQGRLYVDRLEGKWAKRWKRARAELGFDAPGQSWLPGTDPDPFGH